MENETVSIDGSIDMEEGEIVDDDDVFEAISSDESLTFRGTGKLNSTKESLRALSLSSISDMDVDDDCFVGTTSSTGSDSSGRRNRPKRNRRRRKRLDENDETSITKKLLHDAVRIDKESSHNKSLRTRLRAMVNVEPEPSEDKESCTVTPVVAEEDVELIELRLEALRTAVINKYEHRKKRVKELLQQQQEQGKKQNESDVNKENSSNNLNGPTPTGKSETKEDEEDEDILRAVLLASIAKKITNKASPKTNPKNAQEEPTPPPPPPERFIISVNNPDSDSDGDFLKNIEEFDDATEQKQQPKNGCVPMNDVERFLKQQRAEVEAKQKKPPTAKTNNIQETKALYKLLPKNKQLEYEKLIEKLKRAEKRQLKKSLVDKKTTVSKQKEEIGTMAKTLNDAIKDIQVVKNGRLQIKGKYRELAPVIKKMNESTSLQKEQEKRIELLVNQLKEARNEYDKSRQTFATLAKVFRLKKKLIDQKQRTAAATTNSAASQTIAPAVSLQKNEEHGLKYTSPLDNNSSAANKINPLVIFCPFEANGSCRDKDCAFNHYDKK